MFVYLAIEYNWKRVGGIFSSPQLANKWRDEIEKIEPNLMWDVFPFEIDEPISDDEAVSDWRER
jgi:hypothetical protein